jgi:hypothetical protein
VVHVTASLRPVPASWRPSQTSLRFLTEPAGKAHWTSSLLHVCLTCSTRQALALEAGEKCDLHDEGGIGGSSQLEPILFYEITVASADQPKLLSRLSEALVSLQMHSLQEHISHHVLQGDLGLNIREAHAFNTNDGYSLDVFVVDGWQGVRRVQYGNQLQHSSAHWTRACC